LVAVPRCEWYERFGTAAEDKPHARDAKARAAQRHDSRGLSAKNEGEGDQ
jgi:hypothetical protein